MATPRKSVALKQLEKVYLQAEYLGQTTQLRAAFYADALRAAIEKRDVTIPFSDANGNPDLKGYVEASVKDGGLGQVFSTWNEKANVAKTLKNVYHYTVEEAVKELRPEDLPFTSIVHAVRYAAKLKTAKGQRNTLIRILDKAREIGNHAAFSKWLKDSFGGSRNRGKKGVDKDGTVSVARIPLGKFSDAVDQLLSLVEASAVGKATEIAKLIGEVRELQTEINFHG